MKIEEFKTACDQVKLSSAQKKTLWMRARGQAGAHKQTRRILRNRLLPVLGPAAVLAALLLILIPIITKQESGPTVMLETEKHTSQSDPQSEESSRIYENYLFLGLETGEGQTWEDSALETLLLISKNRTNGMLKLVWIPRHLPVVITDSSGEQKIDWPGRAYEDGAEAVKRIVEEQLGISVTGTVEMQTQGAEQWMEFLEAAGGALPGSSLFDGLPSGESGRLVRSKRILEAMQACSADEMFDLMKQLQETSLRTDLTCSEAAGLLEEIGTYEIEDDLNLANCDSVEYGEWMWFQSNQYEKSDYVYFVKDWDGLREEVAQYLFGYEE